MEQRDRVEDVQNGIWCDRQMLANGLFIDPQHQSVVEKYLIELENKRIPKLRPPWARSGWLAEVCTWIEGQLEELGYRSLAPVEYVKSSAISCVLRIKTTAGNLYFKQAASLPLFCHEPLATLELSQLFPGRIPNVIAIDRQRRWMLLGDFGTPIGSDISLQVQQDVYRSFAQLQIQSIPYRDRLLAVGCLDRRLERLASQIEPLFDDKDALSQLSTAESDRLQRLAPRLKNLCSQLAGYKIPETLVHGDLHLFNIALNRENYLFFDWTDSCVAHPFFDLFNLLLDRRTFLEYFSGWWKRKSRESLRDRYLSQWIPYESSDRLLEAWKIAKPLCALHHAVTYQYLVSNLEPRSKPEFDRALPKFLRAILQSV